MAEQSGFFPDVGGDRQYTTDFLAKWIASFIGNGTYDGELSVTADANMQVKLPAGRAWINGYYYRNDADLALVIANADGVLNRKDTVALRWDVNVRSISVQVLQGTPASSPIAPAVVRTAEQYDLKLAEISIPAGTTAITQALITDTRLDNTVCGVVTGVISQVDTSTLLSQYQAAMNANESQFESDFNTWFNTIKGQLSGDVAGNLQNEIGTLSNLTTAEKGNLVGAVNEVGTALNEHKADYVQYKLNLARLNSMGGMS